MRLQAPLPAREGQAEAWEFSVECLTGIDNDHQNFNDNDQKKIGLPVIKTEAILLLK